MALSALTVVLALCLAGVGAMLAQLRVADAAAAAAKLAARGDDPGARAAVTQLAPAGAVLELTGSSVITAQVEAPPLGSLLPGVSIRASAVASREPTGAP